MLKDAAPWRGARALLLALLAMAFWAGCSPDDFLLGEDDRDRNLQKARDSERLGDFDAAAEYYERALERSSKSPMVHLGYAALCEGQLRRYPDAVYHYQRYLRLLPAGDGKGEDIRRRITNCTERLATSVPLVIRSETIARDLQAVRNENLSLRAQVTNYALASIQWSNEWVRLSQVVTQLQGQVQLQSQALARAQSQLQSQSGVGLAGGSASSPASGVAGGPAGAGPGTGRGPGLVPRGNRGAGVGPTTVGAGGTAVYSGAARVHRVQPGETLDRIARQHGVSVRALQSANPRVDARRLRPGVELRIPAR